MKILIAEDDPVSRRVLETTLIRWQHEVIVTVDGDAALSVLKSETPPQIVILDWMMPGFDGVQVCREVRQMNSLTPPYIILLTARNEKEDIVAGLDAGADDYLSKPFDRNELQARIKVGIRVAELQNSLSHRVKELEAALNEVKQLHGILPICSYCKMIRNDQNYWQRVENYISEHSSAEFSHGVCPACYEGVVKPELERIKMERRD